MPAPEKVLHRLIIVVSAIIVIPGLAACNFPGAAFPIQAPSNQVTSAHETVSARMTLTLAQPSTVSSTSSSPLSSPTNSPETRRPGQTPTLVVNLPPQGAITTEAKVPCNRAAPGSPIDVTIPDDTLMLPGEAFSKTWRLRNTGACTWTRDYALTWFSSERFGAPGTNRLTVPVTVGQTIDLTLDMHAPDEPGAYQSYWKLRDSSGEMFGIGPDGSSPFWVRIVVIQPPSSPVAQTPTPPSTPEVYLNRIVSLSPNDSLDLDTGQKDPADSTLIDLVYTLASNELPRLTPNNNARFGPPISDPPKMADCKAAILSDTPIALETISAGSYICLRSSEGLPGWLRLVLFDSKDRSLAVEILIWSVP